MPPENQLVSEIDPSGMPEGDLNPVKHEVPMVLEHALIRNLAMLQQHNLASVEDCSQVAATVRNCWESGVGADPIDRLARLRTGEGNMLDASVEVISHQLAKSLPVTPTRVPFAAMLRKPALFYKKFPEITLLCKLMMVPIAYREDLDVIGIASINPFFMDALALSVAEEISKVSPTVPIVSMIRLDYVGWMKMYERHFK